MPRKSPPETAADLPAVHTINPTGVYSAEDVRRILHLKPSSLRREIREGRLSVCKRCGRYYFLGRQLLAWLESGELHRRPQQGEDEHPTR